MYIHNKLPTRMNGVIRQIEDQCYTPLQLAPMIHIAQAIVVDNDSEYSERLDSDNTASEWRT